MKMFHMMQVHCFDSLVLNIIHKNQFPHQLLSVEVGNSMCGKD